MNFGYPSGTFSFLELKCVCHVEHDYVERRPNIGDLFADIQMCTLWSVIPVYSCFGV